jgi:hypothetical protein
LTTYPPAFFTRRSCSPRALTHMISRTCASMHRRRLGSACNEGGLGVVCK